eukprot:TRINITY_DN817_c9_g1_i1.p1 TRINITY_DN817_c9_g1~~TRINITY_DN817_c9_g1_i1.p1  ORF type:complete len:596 (+),score=154.23 TRINITY_DN817_c9_g1_i1:92-1879(+)
MARESTEVARGPTPGNAKKPLQKSGGVNKANAGNVGKRGNAPAKKEEKPKAPEGPSIKENSNFKPSEVMTGVSWADRLGSKNKKPEAPKQQPAPKQPAQPKPAPVEPTPAPAAAAEPTPAPVAPVVQKVEKKKKSKQKKQPAQQEPKKQAPKSAFELADPATIKDGSYHAISAKLVAAVPSDGESAEAFQKFSSQSLDVVLPEGASVGRTTFNFSGVAQEPVEPATDAFATGSWAESIEGSPIAEQTSQSAATVKQTNVIQPPSATTTTAPAPVPVKTSPAASLLQRGPMPAASQFTQPTTTSMPAATMPSSTPSSGTPMPSMPMSSSYDRSNWGTPGPKQEAPKPVQQPVPQQLQQTGAQPIATSSLVNRNAFGTAAQGALHEGPTPLFTRQNGYVGGSGGKQKHGGSSPQGRNNDGKGRNQHQPQPPQNKPSAAPGVTAPGSAQQPNRPAAQMPTAQQGAYPYGQFMNPYNQAAYAWPQQYMWGGRGHPYQYSSYPYYPYHLMYAGNGPYGAGGSEEYYNAQQRAHWGSAQGQQPGATPQPGQPAQAPGASPAGVGSAAAPAQPNAGLPLSSYSYPYVGHQQQAQAGRGAQKS